MQLRKFAFVAAAIALAAPVFAESHVEPAVQPGGDIPAKFHPAFAADPQGGDIPSELQRAARRASSTSAAK